jgi:hypothetical protein
MPISFINRNNSGNISLINRSNSGRISMTAGSSIVTAGLVLNLDAGNPASYPGTGTTWTSLAGNNYSGSLLNGTAFSSTNGGNLVFDGVDDYVNVTEIGQLTRFSIESWFRPTAYPGNYAAVIASVYPGTNATVNFKIGYEAGTGMTGGTYIGNWFYTPTVPTTLNTWQQIIFTYDGSGLAIYSNGVSGGSNAFTGTPNSGGAGIRIGRRWDISDYFVGNIAITRIYNRALSAAEILQNYNATKTRFGL